MIKKLIKQLMPYLWPYRKKAFAAFLLSFVLAAVAGYQLKLVQPIFDKGFDANSDFSVILKIAGTPFLSVKNDNFIQGEVYRENRKL